MDSYSYPRADVLRGLGIVVATAGLLVALYLFGRIAVVTISENSIAISDTGWRNGQTHIPLSGLPYYVEATRSASDPYGVTLTNPVGVAIVAAVLFGSLFIGTVLVSLAVIIDNQVEALGHARRQTYLLKQSAESKLAG